MNEGRHAWLSTRQRAARIGVTTGFVRGEIRDGGLSAGILRRPGKRQVYRVDKADFAVYVGRHWSRSGNTTQDLNVR